MAFAAFVILVALAFEGYLWLRERNKGVVPALATRPQRATA